MDTLAHRVIVIHWAYQWVGLKLLAVDNTTCHCASHPANGVQDLHLICLVNPAGKALKLGFPSSSRPGSWRWSAGHTTSWSRPSLAHITRQKISLAAHSCGRRSSLQVPEIWPPDPEGGAGGPLDSLLLSWFVRSTYVIYFLDST